MHRVQIGESALNSEQVVCAEPTAYVDVLREQRHPMGHGREPSDHDELDLMLDQAFEERFQVRQDGSPWRFGD
jgi:hypothetical protein